MTNQHERRALRQLEWFVVAAIFLVCGAFNSVSTARAQGLTLPAGFNDDEINYFISNPTAMAVAPDGRIFVAQKFGSVKIIKNGVLLSTPFLTRSVNGERERGMIGITLDPNFAQNHYVYIRYTTSGTCRHNLERVTAQGDVEQPGSAVLLFDIGACVSVGSHNGGTIHFGADGTLFTSVGEQGCCPNNAQSFDHLFGKLLRLNPDGTIPTDNPFYNSATGNNRAIWALGLRNPFVFAIQPTTGRILINDVGFDSWEEVNVGMRGANYGWPACEGPCNPPNPAYVDPLYSYAHNEGCSITGGVFYNPTAAQFPASYTGKYFFTDYCGGWIRTLDLSNNSVAPFASNFHTEMGQPVDLDLAPDGSLYWLAQGTTKSDSSLHRIRVSNLPGISRNPRNAAVDAGIPVTFTVFASGNGPFTYQWQRNEANIAGATSPTLSFITTAADNGARFRAIVNNAAGNATSQDGILTVHTTNNTPPSPTINLPVAGTQYRSGDSIAFSGTSTDPQDGDLPASAFNWEFVFHHASHTHDFVNPVSGVKSDSFDIPLVDEYESNVWYRIHLTVRDSQGLTSTTYLDITPLKSTITLASNPPGLQVTLDGRVVTTPYSVVSVENQPRTLGVVSPQTVNGVTYVWNSWSNGRAATHIISTPQTDQTYTASLQPPDAMGGGIYLPFVGR